MKLRISLASTLAAALVAGTVATASAQSDTTRRSTAQDSTRRTTTDTTRRATSQRRVRVTKEATGEVATPRPDSTTRPDSMSTMRSDSIARADSLARMEQMRRDSVTRDSTARADSIARASAAATTTTTTASSDTIRQPATPTMTSESDSYGVRRAGWYVGLGGGPNVPTGTVSDVYKTGFNVEVPIGWQPASSPLGFRVDLGYSRLNGRSAGTNGLTSQLDDPSIWSATANLTLDLVKFGENRRGSLYLVGGGGVFRFTDFNNSDASDNNATSAFEGSPVTKGGITGGAGLAFPIGGTSLFVETRYTTAYTEGNNTRWVPVVFGLKWR